jgi:hypothetical protein
MANSMTWTVVQDREKMARIIQHLAAILLRFQKAKALPFPQFYNYLEIIAFSGPAFFVSPKPLSHFHRTFYPMYPVSNILPNGGRSVAKVQLS